MTRLKTAEAAARPVNSSRMPLPTHRQATADVDSHVELARVAGPTGAIRSFVDQTHSPRIAQPMAQANRGYGWRQRQNRHHAHQSEEAADTRGKREPCRSRSPPSPPGGLRSMAPRPDATIKADIAQPAVSSTCDASNVPNIGPLTVKKVACAPKQATTATHACQNAIRPEMIALDGPSVASVVPSSPAIRRDERLVPWAEDGMLLRLPKAPGIGQERHADQARQRHPGTKEQGRRRKRRECLGRDA